MNNDVLVTVVIPVYNSENYINECLYATTNQTYRNLEILVVNDGSLDSTESICQKYAESDTRIRIITNDNNGASAARNLGICNATGKYVVFFDADDRPDLDLIERYVIAKNEWNDEDISLIVCGMYYDSPIYKHIDDEVRILVPDTVYTEGKNYILDRSYVAALAWLKIFNFVTNKLYKLDCILRNEIRFDEGIHIGEDLKFNLDYLSKVSGKLGMVNKALYHYIKRSSSSLSYTYHENDIEDTKMIYRRFIKWAIGLPDVTDDDILVIQSIYLTDWISRLSTMYDHFKHNGKLLSVEKRLNSEISCPEFQNTLKKVHRARKISTLRYLALRTGKFYFFFWLRGIYKRIK